ncbi:hypothetical protein [Mesorhizobium sp.]|uniref:hypothetical protein n=1 Tax=Mesorhizobium sp. TaxID=1871066 RepID=UPI000FE565E5|nr:hypothetical protein [Mesorhizobium sp.]RWE79205.1 MAG: hypothetical protein EOS42_02605 [Mesorhizobium sp.]TIV32266.1 MAG: hypothetical protein E5V90_03880 [Mesorhizobium sp.]
MNIRRGVFRLWVVATLLCAVAMGFLWWDEIEHPFMAPLTYIYKPDNDTFPDLYHVTSLPQPRVELQFDYNVTLMVPGNPPAVDMDHVKSYFTEQHVETRASEFRQKRLMNIAGWALFTAVPAICVFIIGALLIWAFAGFSRATPRA